MTRLALRQLIPKKLHAPPWGDRKRWGLVVDAEDSCWREWEQTDADFYLQNQRQGIGKLVSDAGYQVMYTTDPTGKRVLEIGAGDIRHLRHWRGMPAEYLLADVSESSTNAIKFFVAKLLSIGHCVGYPYLT